MLKGLSSNISTGEVLCRGLGCAPEGKSKMCQKQSEPVTSRARKRDIERGVLSRRGMKTHDHDGLLGDERPYAQQLSNQSLEHPESKSAHPSSPPGMGC